MHLVRPSLELLAGRLSPARFPRLVTEVIAAGNEAATLRRFSSLLGESQTHALTLGVSNPGTEMQLSLRALQDASVGALAELRAVVAREHVGRVRQRLVR